MATGGGRPGVLFMGPTGVVAVTYGYQEEQITESNILIYTTPEGQVPNIRCRCLCLNYDTNKLVTRHYSCIIYPCCIFPEIQNGRPKLFGCLLEGQRTPCSNTRFSYPNRQVLRQVVDQHILQKDEAPRDFYGKQVVFNACSLVADQEEFMNLRFIEYRVNEMILGSRGIPEIRCV